MYGSFNYYDKMQARFLAGPYLLGVNGRMSLFLMIGINSDIARLSEETIQKNTMLVRQVWISNHHLETKPHQARLEID